MSGQRAYLIDPPSCFSPLADWQAFLESMEGLNDPDQPQVREAMAEARAMIVRLEKGPE